MSVTKWVFSVKWLDFSKMDIFKNVQNPKPNDFYKTVFVTEDQNDFL
jgi:hypothetical protein